MPFCHKISKSPKYKGIKYHAIAGSHDQTHLFNYGMVLGEEIAKRRPDFEYLGQDKAYYYFDNCKMEIFHPGGGTSSILSSKPQNGIDQIPSNSKPKISLRGHYHKIYVGSIRNIITFLLYVIIIFIKAYDFTFHILRKKYHD